MCAINWRAAQGRRQGGKSAKGAEDWEGSKAAFGAGGRHSNTGAARTLKVQMAQK